MSLSNDLISQFVKITKDEPEAKKETIVYGTIVKKDDAYCVVIDGSKTETPIRTTSDIGDGNRVIVMIKNHTATVIGNISSPSGSKTNVDSASSKAEEAANTANTTSKKVDEFEQVIADKVSTEELAVEQGRITKLESDNVTIRDNLNANTANIETLTSDLGEFETVTTERLDAIEGSLKDLDVEDLNAKYANIDFSNIGEAAIEEFLSKSGMIDNLTVGNGTVTGVLVGVTIKGDIIEGGTVIADKLVIQGEDGLYYKLNTDGVTTESEQTEYNSLNGSVITAKSITAEKVSVDDLVAFGATIGGFNITTDSLYSGVKESIDNVTQGIYLDGTGQIAIGDGDNYLRYFQDENGNWKLQISAESILFGDESKSSASDIKNLTEHVKIGTYIDEVSGDSKPCVELSEGDSEFKQIITNTSTMFMDGAMVRTKVDSDGITSENITVTGENRQGGFAWKIRSNGNLALVWKGVDE